MSEPEKRPNRWHRVGVIMSLAALVVIVAAGAFLSRFLPANWHILTRHSDNPAQFIQGVEGLDREITTLRLEAADRVQELQNGHLRALRKAQECREGIGEDGEKVDAAKLEELAKRAPEWDRAAAAAEAAVLKYAR